MKTMSFGVLYLFSITENHARVFLEEKKLEKYLSRQEFTEVESQKDVIRHWLKLWDKDFLTSGDAQPIWMSWTYIVACQNNSLL